MPALKIRRAILKPWLNTLDPLNLGSRAEDPPVKKACARLDRVSEERNVEYGVGINRLRLALRLLAAASIS